MKEQSIFIILFLIFDQLFHVDEFSEDTNIQNQAENFIKYSIELRSKKELYMI